MNKRILAIDYGKKRTGLAVSDPLGICAQPLKTVASDKLAELLPAIVAEYEPGRIILGWPLKLNGQEGPAALNIKAKKQKLEKLLGVPIELVDERLTSVQANQILRQSNLSGSKRRTLVDKVAAAVILDNYLARL